MSHGMTRGAKVRLILRICGKSFRKLLSHLEVTIAYHNLWYVTTIRGMSPRAV
ncbi:hypothetical protein HAX54_034804, partial [Datura stramonium]|nr:hypothetical protein [Datura stramonium]